MVLIGSKLISCQSILQHVKFEGVLKTRAEKIRGNTVYCKVLLASIASSVYSCPFLVGVIFTRHLFFVLYTKQWGESRRLLYRNTSHYCGVDPTL